MSASNQLQSANENVIELNDNLFDESGDDGNDEKNIQLTSDEEIDPDMCGDCLCLLSPCVTTNRQSWFGNGKRAHAKNRNLRFIL